jgi:hypothetical protein
MPDHLRRIVLFVVPLLVGTLNLAHPMVRVPVYDGILRHLDWWITLHILNLAGFPLLGLAAYLLVKDVNNAGATVAKIAIAIFVPVYTAFDALAGVGTGTLVQQISCLSPEQSTTFKPTVDAFWNSAPLTASAIVGSIAWVIATLSTAVALTVAARRKMVTGLAVVVFFVGGWARSTFVSPDGSTIGLPWWLIIVGMGLAMFLAGNPRVPGALLTLAGALFSASHAPPTGPLAMACFLGAVVYLELVMGQQGTTEQSAAI